MSDLIQPKHSQLSLTARIEALLFVAPEPVTSGQLARVLDVTTRRIEKGLEEIELQYQDRGICIQRHDGRVRLTTSPEAAPFIEFFLGLEATTQLSRAALETLAIIAYQQPVTRPHVDSIRGVNSDSVMKNLLSKGVIQEIGRAEGPGRPILYSTTPEFLSHFGLISLEELPPLNIEDIINNNHKENGETKILKE
ncbi:MAG: SMC-Scp complex subunit ScpB [Anaerolineales bacterium]|nr:SMC-Scp complex subunit ScpB [Anaerolineales bacterium]